MKTLVGKIAVVTGASRGIGKGVALGLAAHGATVYITGRTEKDNGLPDFMKGATIHKTVEEVNQEGGIGIAAILATTRILGLCLSGSKTNRAGLIF